LIVVVILQGLFKGQEAFTVRVTEVEEHFIVIKELKINQELHLELIQQD